MLFEDGSVVLDDVLRHGTADAFTGVFDDGS